MEFEWNDLKEKENVRKHKVNFTEAMNTFFDSQGLLFKDEFHSQFEKRFYWIGKSAITKRILTTYFTKRGHKIRIIGCAEWRKFRRIYETTQNK